MDLFVSDERALVLILIYHGANLVVYLLSWSSLVKEESLAGQITSPFISKLGCF